MVTKTLTTTTIDGVYSYPAADWTLQHALFTRRARFSLRPVVKATLRSFSMNLSGSTRPREQPDGTVVLDVENVPGFQEEQYIPPEDTLKARVLFFYVVGLYGNSERFWIHQAKQSAIEVEKFVGNSKSVKHAVAELVKPDDHPETKLRRIYQRVQQLRYLTYEPAKIREEERRENLKENKNAEDVLDRGYARANEANLLFVALARAAGFDAAVVLVSARDHQFFHREILDPSQLTAMVVAVRMGSKDSYFDAATLYCPYGLLPWEESGVQGYRLSSNAGVPVTIANPVSTNAIIERESALDLHADGGLHGSLRVVFVGQEALERRLENREVDAVGRRKALEDEVKGWLPPGASVQLKNEPEWEKSGLRLSAQFEVDVPGFATLTGSRLLLQPALFQSVRKYPFQESKRVHPIYFRYPYQVQDDLTVNLPVGYEVESLPERREKTFPFGRYEITREAQGRAVRLVRHMVMDRYFIQVQDYSALRVFYDIVRAGDEEQVVLKAVEEARAN